MRSKRYSEFVRIHTYKIAEEILRPVLQKSYLISIPGNIGYHTNENLPDMCRDHAGCVQGQRLELTLKMR